MLVSSCKRMTRSTMSLDFYEKLMDIAVLRRQRGDRLAGELVYYSARDPMRCHQTASQGTIGYEGSIRHDARCIDVSEFAGRLSTQDESVDGLHGERIQFQCHRKPKKSKVYHRTRTDRGHRGTLRDPVRCRIVMAVKWAHNTSQ